MCCAVPCAVLRAAGVHRTVDVKHKTADQVATQVRWLRSSSGRKTEKRIDVTHKTTTRPSIQGKWTPFTFAAQPMQVQAFEAAAEAAAAAAGGAEPVQQRGAKEV